MLLVDVLTDEYIVQYRYILRDANLIGFDNVQAAAYSNCVKKAKRDGVKWLAMIDADEHVLSCAFMSHALLHAS
jgi:hypothetical protein